MSDIDYTEINRAAIADELRKPMPGGPIDASAFLSAERIAHYRATVASKDDSPAQRRAFDAWLSGKGRA